MSTIKNIVSTKYISVVVIVILFFFRLAFGLCSEFWFEDERQIYLIGLKFYTSGQFPFFGPDIVYTSTQIPGALQGLLVGLPLYIWHAPEAPYILLNLLSTASLLLLAYYISRRIEGLPSWFIYVWLLTCPWTLNFSTHILNPSYVLPAAIVFFIGFMEAIPALRIGMIKQRYAFLMMGLALLWIFQLHMSWILLIPFVLFALVLAFRKGWKEGALSTLIFLAGSLITGSLLIPTLIKYGLSAGSGGTADNIVWNWRNIGQGVTVFTRYLSLASFELPRFIGANNADRITFIKDYLWASPFIVFLTLMGFAQVLWIVIASFLKNSNPGFKLMRLIAAVTFMLIWLSFLFSVKGPSSHTFYVIFPFIMIYSFYCWRPLFEKRWIRMLAAVMLFSGIVFHSVLMYDNFHKKSMYINRDIPLKAIKEKDYHILGERRSYDRNH